MKNYGVINKITGELLKTYWAKGKKPSPKYPDSQNYVHFEIATNNNPQAYFWNGTSVTYNAQYTPPQDDITKRAKKIVEDAMLFGQNLIIQFAGENVALGITQAGKTKEVADYLQQLDRYMRSGSLYESISEIDRLIAAGLPQNLAPFITEARLTGFKQTILEYLT